MPLERPESEAPEAQPPKRRRALSHVGGRVEAGDGPAALLSILERALDVRVSEEAVLADLHGFHSYPARMHPDTAKVLIESMSRRGETVLDPFCGSGTVLVAAQRLERVAFGSDLNPIAVELASLKTARLGAKFAESIEQTAARVAEHAKDRQKQKLGPTVPYGPEDRELFATYVLLELDGLRDGIEALGDPPMERALFLVLSAILTKLSLKAGDASSRTTTKRIARGYAIRFFAHKAHDLAQRLVEAKQQTPRGARPARVELTDARRLGFVADRSVGLIVTSPPYPGVYDYFNHHALRLRWLRFDGRGLAKYEIGPRRSARRGAASIGEWERDFTRVLEEMRRVLRPGGKAVLLVADSSLAGKALEVDRWLPRLAERAELRVVARAAQRRPHFHRGSAEAFGDKPRREHLVVLEAP